MQQNTTTSKLEISNLLPALNADIIMLIEITLQIKERDGVSEHFILK